MSEFFVSSKELSRFLVDNKCVILKFSASWCRSCNNEKVKKGYEYLKNKYNDYIKFVELDIDDYEDLINNTEYYNFNIKVVPTFKIYIDGNIVSEHNDIDRLIENIEAVN